MSVDTAGILYGVDSPLYDIIGVPAVFDAGDTGGPVDITVIDKTEGIEVESGGDIAVNTFRPACAVRAVELTAKGIALSDLKDAEITFSGKTWTIENKLNRPGPSGLSTGEFYLILTEAAG